MNKEEKIKVKSLLFANVKIPIEVQDDGTIEPLKKYITIEFSKCNELPPKQDSEVNYSFLMNNIKDLLKNDGIKTNTMEMSCQTCDCDFINEHEIKEKEEEEEKEGEKGEKEIIVLKTEIKNGLKVKKNTSFKSNPKQLLRHTIKTYS